MEIIQSSDEILAERSSQRQVINRAQLSRLAEEQVALRRVAARVAGGATPAKVFEVVSAEVGLPFDFSRCRRSQPLRDRRHDRLTRQLE